MKQKIVIFILLSIITVTFSGIAYADSAENSLLKGDAAYSVGDYTIAAVEFRKAADQGNGMAQNNLGVMYDEGRGVSQDYSEAVNWYRKAAEQGDSKAQFNLGLMYAIGHGEPQNLKTAYIWLSISAANSVGSLHEDAAELRDTVAEKLSSQQLNQAQQIASEWRPKKELEE